MDFHGRSEVNWAAVAFSVANGGQLNHLQPCVADAPQFWGEIYPRALVRGRQFDKLKRWFDKAGEVCYSNP